MRQIGGQLIAGREQFLFVDDVVAVEDGAGLVPGEEHGDAFGDAGADQVAGGGAPAVVEEAGRHPGGRAGGAPGRAPAPDGALVQDCPDSARVVVADQLARSTLLADNLRVRSRRFIRSTRPNITVGMGRSARNMSRRSSGGATCPCGSPPRRWMRGDRRRRVDRVQARGALRKGPRVCVLGDPSSPAWAQRSRGTSKIWFSSRIDRLRLKTCGAWSLGRRSDAGCPGPVGDRNVGRA